MVFCFLLTLQCLPSPLSTTPEVLMDHVSGRSWGCKAASAPLGSHLYWYAQNSRREQSEIKTND